MNVYVGQSTTTKIAGLFLAGTRLKLFACRSFKFFVGSWVSHVLVNNELVFKAGGRAFKNRGKCQLLSHCWTQHTCGQGFPAPCVLIVLRRNRESEIVCHLWQYQNISGLFRCRRPGTSSVLSTTTVCFSEIVPGTKHKLSTYRQCSCSYGSLKSYVLKHGSLMICCVCGQPLCECEVLGVSLFGNSIINTLEIPNLVKLLLEHTRNSDVG